ncbi:MAG: FG-GAP-like repeat-containing protein, partial [Candidatus Eremiobacterota bacterium]
MRPFLLVLVVLGSLVAFGCGESGVAGPPLPPDPAPPAARTIVVRHTLLRAVPASVTHFRFTGRDATGTVVFGPETRAKAPEITLTVPDSLTRLEIEYLQGGTVVGTFAVSVVFTNGTFLIEDPAWVDVLALQSIQVTPDSASVPAGFTRAFTATGVFSNQTTQDLTTQVNWSSLDPGVASVSNTGVATGVTPGTTPIRASLASLSGQAQLTVTAALLTSMAVTPANPAFLSSCRPRQFTATGTFSDGSTLDVTAQAEWSSTNPAVANISNTAPDKGSLRTTGPGTTQVQAAAGSITGSSTVTVSSDPLARYPGPQFAVGTNPFSVALGDVNGDGRLDLATANVNSNDASVLLGNGDGTFQAAQNFAAGANPFSVALGDVNGDGRLDLATANHNSNDASVLLGNGDGTFQAA